LDLRLSLSGHTSKGVELNEYILLRKISCTPQLKHCVSLECFLSQRNTIDRTLLGVRSDAFDFGQKQSESQKPVQFFSPPDVQITLIVHRALRHCSTS